MVKKSKSNSPQHSHYIAIVAIVAVVAVLILVMNSMETSTPVEDMVMGEVAEAGEDQALAGKARSLGSQNRQQIKQDQQVEWEEKLTTDKFSLKSTKQDLSSKYATFVQYSNWLNKKESCEQIQLICFEQIYNELWPINIVIDPLIINSCVKNIEPSCNEYSLCQEKGVQAFSYKKSKSLSKFNNPNQFTTNPNGQEFILEVHCTDTLENKGELMVKCTYPDIKTLPDSVLPNEEVKFDKNLPLIITLCVDGEMSYYDFSDVFTPLTDEDGTKKILYDYGGVTKTKQAFADFECNVISNTERSLCVDYVAAPGAIWFVDMYSPSGENNNPYPVLGYHIE